MQLGQHFTLEELIFSELASRQGYDNTPSDEAVTNLKRLVAQILEPMRVIVGPIHINSGYRSPEVNAAIGGAVNSAHMEGRAADCTPMIGNVQGAFELMKSSNLPYDQLIFECNAWIHVSVPPLGQISRKQVLLASGSPGHWSYQEVV